MRLLIIVSILLSFGVSKAESIIADVASDVVRINHDFTGEEILLYGYRQSAGRIVVILRGDKKNYLVRKKEKKFGIWANKDSILLENVDSFFYSATSGTLQSIQNDNLLEALDIGYNDIKLITKLDNLVTDNADLEDGFKKAFLQKMEDNRYYFPQIVAIDLSFDPLFRTNIKFPETIRRGKYVVEIYLFANGNLVTMQTIPINVVKTGIDAIIYDAAHNNKSLYGFLVILIAVISGLLANKFFRRG